MQHSYKQLNKKGYEVDPKEIDDKEAYGQRKPSSGKTRLVVEFISYNQINPLDWKIVGVDQNTWKLELTSLPKNSFKTISEGYVNRSESNIAVNKNDFRIIVQIF